jgi:putative ABC transport system permease protein
LGETGLICLVGIGAGILLSYFARSFFVSTFPTLSIVITFGWIVRAALIAAAGALVGASYPAWLASRKDVIEALAYD